MARTKQKLGGVMDSIVLAKKIIELIATIKTVVKMLKTSSKRLDALETRMSAIELLHKS